MVFKKGKRVANIGLFFKNKEKINRASERRQKKEFSIYD